MLLRTKLDETRPGTTNPLGPVKGGSPQPVPDRKRPVLSVAMIGCGEIAYSATAPALMAARNARLILVMDVDAKLAASLGQTCNVPYTTDLQEFCTIPRLTRC